MRKASCELCKRFYKFRPHKRFCSDRCRFKAWVAGLEEPGVVGCYYCGMPAESIDHLPPRSVRPFLLEADIRRWPFVEIDACIECNSLLGVQPPWLAGQRKVALKAKLRRKYAKYLKLPEWTEEELMKFEKDSMLAGYIREGMIFKKMAAARISW